MAADEDSLGGALIFVVAVLALAVVAMLRIFGWNYLKGWLATGWSTTQARVEFGSVEEHRIRYFTYYVARIDYSYSYNNEYYSGYSERVFLRESSADRFVASMKDKPIFVRANPQPSGEICPSQARSARRMARVAPTVGTERAIPHPCHDLGNLDSYLLRAHSCCDFNHYRLPLGGYEGVPPFENSKSRNHMLPGCTPGPCAA
jgi:hypothetical protein